MSFDVKKFRNAKLNQRVKEVAVPQLKSFFSEDEQPIFKLRNLTGHELAICNEAVKSNLQIRTTLEKLLSEDANKKAEAICESLGVSKDKTPDDLVRRINILRLGSLDPELTNEDSVRFAAAFPEIFYNLTNKILNLTHLGADLGELNASGVIRN